MRSTRYPLQYGGYGRNFFRTQQEQPLLSWEFDTADKIFNSVSSTSPRTKHSWWFTFRVSCWHSTQWWRKSRCNELKNDLLSANIPKKAVFSNLLLSSDNLMQHSMLLIAPASTINRTLFSLLWISFLAHRICLHHHRTTRATSPSSISYATRNDDLFKMIPNIQKCWCVENMRTSNCFQIFAERTAFFPCFQNEWR